MFKGRLFKAVKNLDREETAFCLAQEPELLHAVDQNGRNLLQIVLSVETVNSDHRTVRQIDLIDYSSAQGLDLHFVDRTKAVCDQVNLVWYAVARSRNPVVVKHLLDRGVKPDGLYAAGWLEDTVLIELLGSYHIDVDPVIFNETPLLHCLKNHKYQSLKPLIDIGSDVNFQDHKGKTVLHHGMDRKVPMAVFKMLLQSGADPDIEDAIGRSPRQVAVEKRDKTWIEFIKGEKPA